MSGTPAPHLQTRRSHTPSLQAEYGPHSFHPLHAAPSGLGARQVVPSQ